MTTSQNPLGVAQQAWEAGHDCTAYLVNILLWKAGSNLRVPCNQGLPKTVPDLWYYSDLVLDAARTLHREHGRLVKRLAALEPEIDEFPSWRLAGKGASTIKCRFAKDVFPWRIGIIPIKPDCLLDDFASQLGGILESQRKNFPAQIQQRWVKAMENNATKWRRWFRKQREKLSVVEWSDWLEPKKWIPKFKKAGRPMSARTWPRFMRTVRHENDPQSGPKKVRIAVDDLRRLGVQPP